MFSEIQNSPSEVGGGILPEPLSRACFVCTKCCVLRSMSFCTNIQHLHYICLTKAKVLPPPLTHFSPSQTEVCPHASSVYIPNGLKAFSSYWPFSSRRHQRKMHTHQGAQEVPLTATAESLGIYLYKSLNFEH